MKCSDTVKQHLSNKGVEFEVVTQSRTAGSMETAAAAHVSGEGLAKAIVLKDKDGHLVAVIPATHKLELGKLNESLGRRLEMAAEAEFAGLFKDCDLGAVPPLAGAYGLDAVIDESLAGTNSHDRRAGAAAIVSRLSDRRAIGLLTTHDLAIAEEIKRDDIRNVHFVDELKGDQLIFDYRVREGQVMRSNAIALMRSVGLPV